MEHRAPPVIACGAWLKNAACLLDAQGQAHWSAVHGDLSDPAACAALEASARALLGAHGQPVRAVAHDLHPDFFSTRFAVELADALGVPAIGVQHHHAHIAAVVAENQLQGPVIGLALDGVGLGEKQASPCRASPVPPVGDSRSWGGPATDFEAWGGELLLVDGARCQRLGHLHPLALPGGDRAAREPWRMAASALHALERGAEIVPRFAPAVGEATAQGVRQMLERGLNSPLTSSTGRWFDAAAAALGLSVRQTDEAEAAIALETAARRWLEHHPAPEPLADALVELLTDTLPDGQRRLDLRGLFARLLDVPAASADEAAAGFHVALADALAHWATQAARQHGTRTVCLGGGCFFNRVLRERVIERLRAAGLEVHLPGASGCGDAGLALGQAWVAARQLEVGTPQNNDTHEKETQPCA
ncbi:carbamoyltransferase HypF [Hydrogenophaga laconesensis]|uniref:Hydrogenase maturation protein HypF n=1 Tax=Hydrogenophaga laconesensis TaxID=1805971 RepID=A0ABU1VGK2_9BURK|nr:carbamoyltransferase HypF [Hydrogenophaga laconesensis]MDR7096596.1 hydrogenase maturation protein HypF [Hydrogenophaga laconesensis]